MTVEGNNTVRKRSASSNSVNEIGFTNCKMAINRNKMKSWPTRNKIGQPIKVFTF